MLTLLLQLSALAPLRPNGRCSAPRMSEPAPPPAAAEWPLPRDGDYVDSFCRATNSFFEASTLPFVRDALTLRESRGPLTPFKRLTAPPESPGLSRPVWLVIAASVPTGLLWYGYYKFSVEEELFYDQLRREGRVTGCGGYGTLIGFSWAVLLGLLAKAAGAPGADGLIDAAALWILLGQVNLYRRVNELCSEEAGGEGPPLHTWWALLPPPLDVVVGLRQVHFLARYWLAVRGEAWEGDAVADKYFPFIASPRFTLREFFSQPSRWFWFTGEWADFQAPELGGVDAGRYGGRGRADKGGEAPPYRL